MAPKRKRVADEVSAKPNKQKTTAGDVQSLWPAPQEVQWTPQQPVVVPRQVYDSMFEAFRERNQLQDYQLYNFDAIPWQIHLVAWEPATGSRHVLLESIGFDNHSSVSPEADFREGISNWLKVETDPEVVGFDGFLLMMTNTYRLVMEDWLQVFPSPQKLFWHKGFAPADIEVLAKFISTYKYRAEEGAFIVCGPVLPANWIRLQRNALLKDLQDLISEEWVKASMTAMEIAKELDSSLLAKRRGCKHPMAKINNLRSLEDEATKQMRLALAGKDLRRFLEGLLPESLAAKPFLVDDFTSKEFIDHMKLVRGEHTGEELDFSG